MEAVATAVAGTLTKRCSECVNVLFGAYGMTCGEFMISIVDEAQAEDCEAWEEQ